MTSFSDYEAVPRRIRERHGTTADRRRLAYLNSSARDARQLAGGLKKTKDAMSGRAEDDYARASAASGQEPSFVQRGEQNPERALHPR